jgi:hypothetical protein
MEQSIVDAVDTYYEATGYVVEQVELTMEKLHAYDYAGQKCKEPSSKKIVVTKMTENFEG